MTELLDAALACFEQTPVIPVRRDKSPYRSGWAEYFTRKQTEDEVRRLFANGVYGMARVLYPACELVELDYDGMHAEETWQKTGINLPETAKVWTPSGGYHLVFRTSALLKKAKPKRNVRIVEATCNCTPRCGVDFLVHGISVIPPTPNYFEDGDYPLEDAVELPDEVVRLALSKRKKDRVKFDGKIPDGMRNDTLTSIAGRLRRKGASRDEIAKRLHQVNRTRCDPPKEDDVIERIAASVARYDPAEKEPEPRDDDVFTSVDSVAATKVSWLWPGWLPIGYVTHVGGDPGAGKTHVCLKVAATVSRGETFPGSTHRTAPSHVVLLSMEDQISDVVRPRLEAMGADLTKIHVIDPKKNVSPGEINMELIEKKVLAVGALLVVLDPIVYFAGGRDINQASQVREMLSPFAAMAARCAFAGMVAGHLNKQVTTKALYRASGSVDFSAVCRSFMVVAEDPEEADRRMIAQPKNSFEKKRRSVSFTISEELGVKWGEESDMTADDLLGKEETRERASHKMAAAKEFLEKALGDGPRTENEVTDKKDASISTRTLWRAKKELKIESKKQEGDMFGRWWWKLPGAGDWPWE